MRDFRFLVLTPPGLLDPALAIAASRAGELGILDLEYASNQEAARWSAVQLTQHARGEYGLKLSCQQGELLSELIAWAPESLSLVWLTGRDPQALRQQVAVVRRAGRRVFLEATDLEEARLGEELGVDAVVAKGNEAGGFVGEETTFVLLQKFLTRLSIPVYAQGGIGLHTVTACYAAGAAGAVLDAQVSLARESQLSVGIKERIAAMDGSETACLGGEWDTPYRFYFRPGLRAGEELRRVEEELSEAQLSVEEKQVAWRNAIQSRVGWADPNRQILPLGQDAAFAASLAHRFVTVSGILSALRDSIQNHCELASRLRPLDQGAPLARSHGTRYPIVQGPMTRVSDNAAFALAVARGGGLPFLALAVMRRAEVISLLEETRRTLGELPWGVGILGFVSPELRQEQLEAIRLAHPRFALIAGGRPDQASLLEGEGIPTYLHVPSPDLLRMFLAEGARRFVFEGRECGGHVGPRSSFVLWELMVDVLLEHLASAKASAEEFHILFAGGIHDALSSSMVATLAAPLAALGVRVGVLMGTAYLFTREAVATGAITPRY
jgi:NAD(P)H-dependent flavin oxidoreductase YrpB (nitropropane dioxygenase family)